MLPVPDPVASFLKDLRSPNGGYNDIPPSLIRTVTAEGEAADAVADVWTQYGALRAAVAEMPDTGAWERWSIERFGGQEGLTLADADKYLLKVLAADEQALAERRQLKLPPFAIAMRGFVTARSELNGLKNRPSSELLPQAAEIDPRQVVGAVALDLAHGKSSKS